MREIRSRRSDGARWFQGRGLDLFVWHVPDGAVAAFQLSFADEGRELALTWQQGEPAALAEVDGGQEPGSYPRAPLLYPAAPAAAAGLRRVLRQFEQASRGIDTAVRACVLDWLRRACDAGERGPA
jgi:hypothetical protein